MDTIKLTVPSTIYHNSQIITGFLALKDMGWDIRLKDQSRDASNPFYDLPIVQAEYLGQRLVYDLWDGYQNPVDMKRAVDAADFYFKRSFSPEKNAALFPEDQGKMYPLGFNYHVTHRDNPINEPFWKAAIKPLTGRTPERYFVPRVFEGQAAERTGTPRVLFLAQLWEDDLPELPEEIRQERQYINAMRMDIMSGLRGRFGENFIGGLVNSRLAQERAPELVIRRKYTERRKYLNLVHSADICIGTMGLYESIGWKTAEYVAAAKAIVNERLRYQVTGDFAEGKNYLAFTDAPGCIRAVERLAGSPEEMAAMKRANREYYLNYLRPDVLVKRTLDLVKERT